MSNKIRLSGASILACHVFAERIRSGNGTHGWSWRARRCPVPFVSSTTVYPCCCSIKAAVHVYAVGARCRSTSTSA